MQNKFLNGDACVYMYECIVYGVIVYYFKTDKRNILFCVSIQKW